MMLATKYNNQDATGMLSSEKLDGWRAFWDGECLRSRTWNVINVPSYITEMLPRGVALDGELWAGRGGFLTIQSLCNSKNMSDPRWKYVRFMVFDWPTIEAVSLEQRLSNARQFAIGPHIGFVEQTKVTSIAAMWSNFRDIVSAGGEGLVLRRPGSFYFFGRNSDWLKVKPCNAD